MLTLVRCPFHTRVTAVARKRPRPFCQKCRWQVTPKHAYTLDPSKSEWADYAAVQAECGNLSGNELTRNSSGNTRLQSSQLAEPLWTDPGLKSGISLHELISTFEKKKRWRGMNYRTFSQNPRTRGKSQHHTIRLIFSHLQFSHLQFSHFHVSVVSYELLRQRSTCLFKTTNKIMILLSFRIFLITLSYLAVKANKSKSVLRRD